MASQIAEREDHVVVEDVQGEHGGCKPKAPDPSESFHWRPRIRQMGVPVWESFSQLLELPDLAPSDGPDP